MLVRRKNGYLTGPFDILCVLHDVKRCRFYPAFLEERWPDNKTPDPSYPFVWVTSRLVHREGFAEEMEAFRYLREELAQVYCCANLWEKPLSWTGEVLRQVVPLVRGVPVHPLDPLAADMPDLTTAKVEAAQSGWAWQQIELDRRALHPQQFAEKIAKYRQELWDLAIKLGG